MIIALVIILFLLILLLIQTFRNHKTQLASKNTLKNVSFHCINLNSSTDRWYKLQKQAKRENIVLNRIQAVDGREIEAKEFIQNGRLASKHNLDLGN